ncbi:MAG: tRNA lysidine(34) synthetase TilS [Pseudomonadales bacterium]|nr:tRNA lysidine(34) synthetase TilS [Pseudomonadales bacterium]
MGDPLIERGYIERAYVEGAYVERAYKCQVEDCSQQLRAVLLEYPSLNNIHVAYSGGMDSHILLLIAQQALQLIQLDSAFSDRTLSLNAVHINHQLQRESNQWQAHCESVCGELGIALVCESIHVVTGQGFSIEEQARVQRYSVFEHILGDSGILLMAHHLDDQMETMLMRLLKGAGATGLAGIPQRRAMGCSLVLRPLLSVSRDQLLGFATLQNLSWIEDPSNASVKYDRNYLRHDVLPLLEQRWPGYRKTWSRTAGVFSDYANLAEQVAQQDYANAKGDELGAAGASVSQLQVAPLLQLDRFRQQNVIRHWLGLNGTNKPEHGWVETIIDEVIGAAADAAPLFEVSVWQVRRYNGAIHFLLRSEFGEPSSFDSSVNVEWDLKQPMCLNGNGILNIENTLEEGSQRLTLPTTQRVSVRYRQGGERCHPSGRSGSRTLKKLLNEYRVEPWLRSRVPLIYYDEELVAVANYFICEGFAAGDLEPGVLLNWIGGHK